MFGCSACGLMRRSHESAVICEVGKVGNESLFNLKCAFMNPKAQRKKRDYCKYGKKYINLHNISKKNVNERVSQIIFPIIFTNYFFMV